jgi:hypothetical protein
VEQSFYLANGIKVRCEGCFTALFLWKTLGKIRR